MAAPAVSPSPRSQTASPPCARCWVRPWGLDYHLNGFPLRFADGSCAAEILLVDRNVSTMRLHLCQYRFSKEPSLLLPLRQTLAIAAQTEDAELFLGYLDRGQSSVSASWLLE